MHFRAEVKKQILSEHPTRSLRRFSPLTQPSERPWWYSIKNTPLGYRITVSTPFHRSLENIPSPETYRSSIVNCPTRKRGWGYGNPDTRPETNPCFIFNDAALVLVVSKRHVSKGMSWEEVAYTPAFERRLLLPSVASSFEPRPVCLRQVALESDFISDLRRRFWQYWGARSRRKRLTLGWLEHLSLNLVKQKRY